VTRSLLPAPRVVEDLSGSVTWHSPLRINVISQWRSVVDTFAHDLATSIGWDVAVCEAGDHDIVILAAPDIAVEGYRLHVGEPTYIEASSAAGVAYALTVLRQLGPTSLWSSSPVALDHLEIARVDIADHPSFAWRGVHLDVSRHFFDVATVSRLIDHIAAHRLNKLHLHLNDDQGWRVEIPSWPRLSDVSSQRRSSPVGHEDDGVDDGVVHRGYYTADDLVTLRDYAATRMVQIVPEIDLPGHAQAVIAAYPQLGNVDEPLEVWTRWGISEHVLNVSPEALAFAEEVVGYVAGLFPGSPVHIGGDECPTSEWEQSALARAVMDSQGFTSARQLQGLFTSRLASVLRASGHEVVAWDEVLDAEVPDGTVIVAWRSTEKAEEAARRGLDVVMAPMQFLYFDWLSSTEPNEPLALAPLPYVTTWETVYDFSVIPRDLQSEFQHHVRGAQVQLWSEYIATRDHLDYMAFPRTAAFSEVVWGTTTTTEDFRTRLSSHAQRLHAMGIRLRPLDRA
jgi:hexosaminidase